MNSLQTALLWALSAQQFVFQPVPIPGELLRKFMAEVNSHDSAEVHSHEFVLVCVCLSACLAVCLQVGLSVRRSVCVRVCLCVLCVCFCLRLCICECSTVQIHSSKEHGQHHATTMRRPAVRMPSQHPVPVLHPNRRRAAPYLKLSLARIGSSTFTNPRAVAFLHGP